MINILSNIFSSVKKINKKKIVRKLQSILKLLKKLTNNSLFFTIFGLDIIGNFYQIGVGENVS